MTVRNHWKLLLLAFAIGSAACDGRPPSAPTPPPPSAPTPPAPVALSVTAISPSTGSTVRDTPVMISGTGFLAGATVTVDVMALSVTVVNSTTITAMAPAHAPGPVDVVVTNPGGSDGTLTAAFTYSVEGPFVVTPSTDTVDAGHEMSVSWISPGARARDWLAVFRVGGSYNDDWWGDTGGATSGSHTLTAPTRPGVYEFRYLVDGSFRDVARSSPVTVR